VIFFRYTSDDFTSIFTEKNQPFSSQNYGDVVVEEVTVEETIETETVETDFTVSMMVDMNQDGIVIEQQVPVTEQEEVEFEAQEADIDTVAVETIQYSGKFVMV